MYSPPAAVHIVAKAVPEYPLAHDTETSNPVTLDNDVTVVIV